ncbi:unnamed protein product [Peniophora sp. CBMAI 1063]|nr:unnamed protein product [Peniophora sp. CBMAI 1063]
MAEQPDGYTDSHVYDVTPDGGLASFNKWLKEQLDGVKDDSAVTAPASDALQHSHATIDELQRVLLEAKVVHNRQVPILRLPVELLGEIFIYVRDSWPTVYRSQSKWAGRYHQHTSWMRIGEVCHRFRDVAEDHSRLWSRLSDDTAPSWAYLVMVALPSASFSCQPIALSLRLGARELDLIIDFLQRLYCPVHELRLTGKLSQEDAHDTLSSIFSTRSLQHLRTLHLDLTTHDGERLITTGIDIPLVRELHMFGPSIGLRNSVFENLESFTASRVKPLGMPRSSAKPLQRAFKIMNSLKHLKLDHATTMPDMDTPFLLPTNLQTFEFTTASTLDFLAVISPSRQVSFTVQCLAPPRVDIDEGTLETVTSNWLGPDVRPTAVSIRISYNTAALDAELRFWRFLSSALSQSCPDVTIRRYIDETYTLSELLRGVCLTDIGDLDLDVGCVSSDDLRGHLKELMDGLPHLHTLRLTESYLPNIFRAPAETDGLRQLRTVYVKQSSTYRKATEYVKEEVHCLAHWLQHRKDMDQPVHTLFVASRVARGLEDEGFAEWRSLVFVAHVI